MASSRNSIVAGVIVLAAAVGFLAWKGVLGYPPKGTEGSIGAAKRYQSEQITPSDVELNDAQTQAFIQSDLFHRMQTDAEFRKAVIDGGLDRYATAQAHATDFARAIREVGRSADAAKKADVAAKAEELAVRADALAQAKDLAMMADADRLVADLSKAAVEFEHMADAARFVEAEKFADLERCTEALASYTDASRGFVVAARAEELAAASREMEKAAEAAKLTTTAKSYADLAARAEELARNRTTARAADVEKAVTGLAKMADNLARSEDVARLVDAEKLAYYASRADAMARCTNVSRSEAALERAALVAVQARELEKSAEAAKLTIVSKQAEEVAAKADELARRSRETGVKAADLELIRRDLAKASLDLSKAAEAAHMIDADKKVSNFARTAESFARVTAYGHMADAAMAYQDLARMIDSGKFATTGN